jgi:hypothetical protein
VFLGKRAEAGVQHHPLPVARQGVALDGDDRRVHPPTPLAAVEIGELPIGRCLGGGDAPDGRFGDGEEGPAVAAETVVDLAAFQHGPAAVAARPKIWRKQLAGDQLLDRFRRLALGRGGQPGQPHQVDIGAGLQPPHHLHAIPRRGKVAEKRLREVYEHGVLAGQGHDGPRVAKRL